MAVSALALQVPGQTAWVEQDGSIVVQPTVRVVYCDNVDNGYVEIVDVNVPFNYTATPAQIKTAMTDAILAAAVDENRSHPFTGLQPNDIILPDLSRG
jgi:hypothetical protein